MPFPNPYGRPKGSVNKTGVVSRRVLEDFMAVFVRLGGTVAMAKWARKNPDAFYTLYARLIPVTLQQAPANPVENVTREEIAKMSDDQLESLAGRVERAVNIKSKEPA